MMTRFVDDKNMIGSIWQDKLRKSRFWMLLELTGHSSYRGFVTDDGLSWSIGFVTTPIDVFYTRIL